MAAHLARGWSSLKLGIRPEFVHVSDEPFVDALAGEVTHVEDLGTYKILTLNLDGQRLKARMQETRPCRVARRGSASPRSG